MKLLTCIFLLANVLYAATVNNPLLWSDVPDPSVVRVDNSYYMVSTTMHFSPGVPIMKSDDLAQWRIVGYAYETLNDGDNQNLENGKNAYGKGSWASSIRYHNGFFYVLTPSYTTGKTHLYKTKDVTGSWSETALPFYHDPSLFFDDDSSAWIFYGSGDISYVELNEDASGLKVNGRSGTLSGVNIESVTGTSNFYVKQEGAHMEKINGEYYLFTISWPAGFCRTQVVYRSKNLLKNYTGKIFLQNNGVAQGGIFDTKNNAWYAMLFRDSGPVGRIPYLVPVSWDNGWPTANESIVPNTLELENEVLKGYGMVTSDDFETKSLLPEWQWNHNPSNLYWSLEENPGHLRLTTSRIDTTLYNAKNTLTQRTFGPKCSGRIFLDESSMKEGDVAGLAALQDSMGFIGIEKSANGYNAVMYQGNIIKERKPLTSAKAFFRIDFDLPLDKGTAKFFYSEDNTNWIELGNSMTLYYTLGMFVGYRFALFYYSTKYAGGYVDFDYFKIGETVNDEIWLESSTLPIPQTSFLDTTSLFDTTTVIASKIKMENFDIKKTYVIIDLNGKLLGTVNAKNLTEAYALAKRFTYSHIKHYIKLQK